MIERLFSTTRIGEVVLKNRIVMTAKDSGYTPEGEVNDRVVGFYQGGREEGWD
jgi:2,4-dienoyl-CoA reductase (NADPH2)